MQRAMHAAVKAGVTDSSEQSIRMLFAALRHTKIRCHVSDISLADLNLSWTSHKDRGLLPRSILCLKDIYVKQKGAKFSNMASVPAPDGQASGPPLDGWH